MAPEHDTDKSINSLEVLAYGQQAVHSIEVAARLAQVPRRLIVLYYRHGLVEPVGDPAGAGWYFDDEAIRVVRRIEYLRSTCGLNLAGIKLVMSLTAEVERLRNELRFHHQT
jgi:MerR family transcriptional regulator, heat shock protein HspR